MMIIIIIMVIISNGIQSRDYFLVKGVIYNACMGVFSLNKA